MNLPELPVGPHSLEDCIRVYLKRLPADDALWPRVSLLLTAYMAWPNDEPKRDSFVATYLAGFIQNSAGETSSDMSAANVSTSQDWMDFENFGGLCAVAKPAFDHLSEEIAQLQRRWLLVADIFQLIVDMAYDDRIDLRRGSSISKAIELCEIERTMPGHSQLRKAWSDFRDVAHLIAAGAHLAHKGIVNATAAHEASILKAVWIAPDAVLALAAGFQERLDLIEDVLARQRETREPPPTFRSRKVLNFAGVPAWHGATGSIPKRERPPMPESLRLCWGYKSSTAQCPITSDFF